MLLDNNIRKKLKIYNVDEYNVRNYHFLVLATFLTLVMLSLVLGFGYITYIFEIEAELSPVKTYGDAVWLMVMSASTIGFGDVYPITNVGRVMVYSMFLLGVGTLGTLGAIFANKIFGFADTNVKNRELRKQNDSIYRKLVELEAKVDKLSRDK